MNLIKSIDTALGRWTKTMIEKCPIAYIWYAIMTASSTLLTERLIKKFGFDGYIAFVVCLELLTLYFLLESVSYPHNKSTAFQNLRTDKEKVSSIIILILGLPIAWYYFSLVTVLCMALFFISFILFMYCVEQYRK